MFITPVLLIIFNRPQTTEKVFNEIRKLKPKYLFIAADGPRKNNPEDRDLCKKCREVVSIIDWDCKIEILYRDDNLGCSIAPAEAISWFFKNVEQGIILEDDCIPNSSFFMFCEELLIKYKYESNIMHITGSNLNEIRYGDGSYYYSRYANVWGWATWRRAWEKFDLELNDLKLYHKIIDETFDTYSERMFWRSRIKLIKSKQIAAWDYQWMFSIWKEKGVSLNSNYNLVINVGFGHGATHTTGKSPYKGETKKIERILHPSNAQFIEKAESEFIRSLHGIKRKGYLEYHLQRHFFQRCQNLVHKIILKANNLRINFQNEK